MLIWQFLFSIDFLLVEANMSVTPMEMSMIHTVFSPLSRFDIANDR